MAPASPIPIESDRLVIPIENCLFSNGTWKQTSQSNKILSSDIQIIQHTLYKIEQHGPPIFCSRSLSKAGHR
jgi:hypothetical protein